VGPHAPEKRVIVYEATLCTACRYCEIACAVWHCGTIDVGQSRIRILFDAGNGSERYAAVNCQHCEDPLCVSACPSEAMQKDQTTGWVTVNSSTCIGCEMCLVACPLSVPCFDETLKVAVKCDFCHGDPECVKHCSSRALRLAPRDEALRVNERLYLGAGEQP
jgi:anaerobic carbon-monoxide dehydrogenase iron sulfur subunit